MVRVEAGLASAGAGPRRADLGLAAAHGFEKKGWARKFGRRKPVRDDMTALAMGAEPALDAFVGDVLGLPDVGLNFLLQGVFVGHLSLAVAHCLQAYCQCNRTAELTRIRK